MTNDTHPAPIGAPAPRYKIGYRTDEWGERSSTPGGIPDPAGAWVRYDDHAAALARAAHAAATKAAPARWYMVNAVGMATLCADCENAEQEANDAQAAWPQMGPHRAVQLVELQGDGHAHE